MSDDRTARRFVAWRLIEQDLEFSTRLVASLNQKPETAWIIAYGIIPYVSMFVYEAYLFLEREYPDVAELIDLKEFSTIRRSRHSAKLLDDPRGVGELARFFKLDVVAHFEKAFAPPANPIGWLLRPLYNDLGLYYYSGHLVNTTHVASFELGIEISRLNSSEDVLAIYEEYGRFLGMLGHTLEEGACSFASVIEPGEISWRDAKSRKYYRDHFDSKGQSYETGLNCLLTALQANLAFLNHLVDIPSDVQSAPSLCKIHLICAVHVVASCKALLASHRDRLDDRSIMLLESAVHDGSGPLLVDQRVKFIRNTLVHYIPYKDFLAVDVKHDQIYCGLIEKYLPGAHFLDILTLAVAETRRLGELIDTWSAR